MVSSIRYTSNAIETTFIRGSMVRSVANRRWSCIRVLSSSIDNRNNKYVFFVFCFTAVDFFQASQIQSQPSLDHPLHNYFSTGSCAATAMAVASTMTLPPSMMLPISPSLVRCLGRFDSSEGESYTSYPLSLCPTAMFSRRARFQSFFFLRILRSTFVHVR